MAPSFVSLFVFLFTFSLSLYSLPSDILVVKRRFKCTNSEMFSRMQRILPCSEVLRQSSGRAKVSLHRLSNSPNVSFFYPCSIHEQKTFFPSLVILPNCDLIDFSVHSSSSLCILFSSHNSKKTSHPPPFFL